jgi:hypothetical protein
MAWTGHGTGDMSPAALYRGSATLVLRRYLRTVRDGEWVRFVIRFEILDVALFREMVDAMAHPSWNRRISNIGFRKVGAWGMNRVGRPLPG